MIFGRRRREAARQDGTEAAADVVRDFADPVRRRVGAGPTDRDVAGAGGPADPTWGSAPSHAPGSGTQGAAGGGFRLTVQDVFAITGRGTVVTGVVESGSIRVGDVVTITGQSGSRSARICGIEVFRKRLQEASAGEHAGLLLAAEIKREDVAPGDVLATRLS